MNIKSYFFLCFLLITSSAFAGKYPSHWWEEVSEDQRQGSWEILPQEAKKGEVILSKRNELGIFSNLAHSPFHFEGQHYASIESLWQMMKYPDQSDTRDPRNNINEYPFSREQIYAMHGFDAKHAGDSAGVINKKYGFKSVSYKKRFFDYKDMKHGSQYHFMIIKRAILAKVNQNPHIKNLLMKTKGLKLMPDHLQGNNLPKSYEYHKILMEIRDR